MLPKHEKKSNEDGRIASFVMHERKNQHQQQEQGRRGKKKFLWEEKQNKSPAEFIYWKNILWMVYHLRKTIILLSVFFLHFGSVHKRVESGKFLNRGKSSFFHKIFIDILGIEGFSYNEQQQDSRKYHSNIKNYKHLILSLRVFVNWFIWSSNPFTAN